MVGREKKVLNPRLLFIATLAVACARSAGPALGPLRSQPSPAVLTLHVTTDGRPLAGSVVKVDSDDGVECDSVPCPTIYENWSGVTDAEGFLSMPRSIVQLRTYSYFQMDGYDLIRLDGSTLAKGSGTLELAFEIKGTNWARRFFAK